MHPIGCQVLEKYAERYSRWIEEMKIIAIVILYNDNTEEAASNIRKVARQVDKVCLVDNSTDSYPERFKGIGNAIYLPQHQNKGIAAAQNIGLKYAIEQQADYVLFSDPDSQIPDEAVTMLFNTYQRMVNEGYKVGGIGSIAYNRSTGSPYPLNSNFIQHLPDKAVTEVTFLMNSISLIPTSLFSQVGLMDESLFIDGIDSEWCWRGAHRYGLRFFLDDHLHIMHQLGLGTRVIGGKERSITPPTRFYYQFRNYLWLCRRDYVPRQWLKENGRKYIIKAIYYPIMVAPRWAYITNICKGVMAGMKATSGTSAGAR
jgi:rhamnosyltransferase